MIGQKLRVKIEGLGSHGEGLAHHLDREIFVPKAAPGDEWEVEVLEEKKGRYLARGLRLLLPSARRRVPRCSHFEVCGGCDFQHLPYSDQIAWKLRMTKHWIRRSPLEPFLKTIEVDCLESPIEWHYRRRVRFQVKDHRLHFFKPHSHHLFEISECPVLEEGFLDHLKKEALTMPNTPNWSRASTQSYEIAGHLLRFDDSCFFQSHLEMNQKLWERIREDILPMESRKSALDLYSGIGNFAIPLRDYFESVVGVESEGASIEWAKKNSDKVEWRAGLSEDVLKTLVKDRAFFNFVLLDPPRSGALETCRRLIELRPPSITYVSCHLESLIKDLTVLVKKGRYTVRRWTVADLFPQTHHIESIVSLVTQL